MLEFIHVADLHASRERKEQCLKALSILLDYVKSHNVEAVLFCGDFWDSTITNTGASGFNDYVTAVNEINKCTKVFMIYGTPLHEPFGSLDIFKSFGVKVFSSTAFVNNDKFELVCIPEPRRTDFISKDGNSTKAINASMKMFIESLPNKNKQRLVMYHGEIIGAKYQNGMDCSCDIALSPSQLKSINADYYACGHIHSPQEIFTNCYYSGSCYPKDFGEQHNCGFNTIKLNNGNIKVERISFGFPSNFNYSADIKDIEKVKKQDFSGKNVKLRLSIEKLFRKDFDQKTLRQDIIKATNANDVKIVFEYKQTSNERSKDVATETNIVNKFKKYASINGIKATESLCNKVQSIQDNLVTERFLPCDSFALEYVSIRGAIGIKDGMGKDEFEIDFTNYKDGIIAITGQNGRGKTTIIENCHPYPQMLTRGGSLKDHFCLKDSHRILIYRTSRNELIKISMYIDGVAKSIGTRYFVETKKENDSWKSNKSVDGSFQSYMDFVNATFGSIDVFLRTSFYAKEQIKSVPDLSRATKTEKMLLFAILAGTDYLNEISEQSKLLMKDEQEKLDKIKGTVSDYDNIKDSIANNKNLLSTNSNELAKLTALNDLDLQELDIWKKKQEEYLTAMGALEPTRFQIRSKIRELDNIEQSICELTGELDELNCALENKDAYKEQQDWLKTHLAEKAKLEKERIAEENEIKNVRSVVEAKELEIAKIKEKESLLFADKQTKTQQLNDLIVPEIVDECPVCGSVLSSEKKESLKKEIAETKKKKDTLKNDILSICMQQELLQEKEKDLMVDSFKGNIKERERKVEAIISDINDITTYAESIDEKEIEYVLKEVPSKIEQTLKEINKLNSTKKQLNTEIATLEKQIENIPESCADKVLRLERGINNTTQEIANLTAQNAVAKKELEKLAVRYKSIEGVDSEIKLIQDSIKEYSIIQKAFSNNGIQALELDSAAPEISTIANAILAETYGDKFVISFDTQRDGSDGRKIDDFIINVFDNESGRQKKLDTLCSGESVWIKQALYFAFSVIRTKRTGFCFKTRFLDESDGSLDAQARPRYLRMIESAHTACNALQTILITHSAEIKDIVEQKIEL